MGFRIESNESFKMPNFSTWLRVYRLDETDFRVIFVEVPGPLVSTSIIVPTTCNDDRGLPHTLEHLIFCGSKSTPIRGYLDNLATRSLSTGTNAYTAEDHTCYEITTAGSEGMEMILPAFIDHIFNPTLKDTQFMTEVYHVDSDGKDQGVVYCEMAARENTEADLLDLHLRKLLYGNQTTYSMECGGKTKDIQNLKNIDVIEYHKKYYHANNASVIICGPARVAEILKGLETCITKYFAPITNYPPICIPTISSNQKFVTETVKFPSEDTEMGSIAYGWKGPPNEDVSMILSLEVLFRCLNDNPSSILPQKFIEIKNPMANDIDLELKTHVDCPIMLVFSGVPYQNGIDDESDIDEEESSDEEADEDLDSDSECSMSSGDQLNLFEGRVYYDLLCEALHDFMSNGLDEPREIQKTIQRHRRKILEQLEESPHETITMNLIPDLIRHYFSESSSLNDTKRHGKPPKVGTRLEFLKILENLENEPVSYWKNLASKFLLEGTVFEVKMIPDPDLAKELADNIVAREKQRVNSWTKQQRKNVDTQVKLAIKDCEVNIDEEVQKRFPPVPDVSKAPVLKYEMQDFQFKEAELPFFGSQVVVTEGIFCQLGLFLSISGLADELRPYLVLFQELFFQSPLAIPASNGGPAIDMDYKEVSKYCSEVLVSHSCGVGMGNSYFSTGFLSQTLTIFATFDPFNWKLVTNFIAQIFLYTEFTKERIVTICKTLLSSITENKRDGNTIVSAVLHRITYPKSVMNGLGNNDCDISIFKQGQFLKDILQSCEQKSKLKIIINNLERIREHILFNETACPGFFRVAAPFKFSLNRTSPSTLSEVSDDFLETWKLQLELFLTSRRRKNRKRKQLILKPFPFPRQPFRLQDCTLAFGSDVMIPMKGIQSSYLTQIVECDLLSKTSDPDFFPTILLAEILSRTEGPLYTGIRGLGYAYGATITAALWTGYLSFDLYRCSEPKKALDVFHTILKDLLFGDKLSSLCSVYEIETAQASIAYRWASDFATADSIVSTALRGSLRGYKNLASYQGDIKMLYEVTVVDLKRVLQKYFALFLESKKLTVLTTPAGEFAESIEKSMASVSKHHLTEFEF